MERKVDLDWIGDYKTSTEGVVRRSPTSYMRVEKGKATCLDIESLAYGFLLGALHAKGKTLEEVTFYPADTIDHHNSLGKPVYVFEYPRHYELETHFE